MSETSKKNTKMVRPTSVDEVPELGRGGLRKSILVVTLLSMLAVAVLIVFVGGFSYSHSVQKQVEKNLNDVATAVLIYYDNNFEGDYNLMINNGAGQTYLYKGDTCISDDTSYIDELSERTGMEITIFFYDTRMMTTIEQNGERIINTIANSNIVDGVLVGQKTRFFNGAKIAGKRYCAQYVPFFGTDGTCIGMIGVCEPYEKVTSFVNRILYITGAAMILALAIMGISMVKYIDKLVQALNYLREFLKKIAEGNLDSDLNTRIFEREDEIGDMGRLANFLRASLKKLVEKDPLTNLNNRRSGQNKINQIRNKAQLNGTPYAVAIGDIDFFKKVNDNYGHDAGDEVLKRVASIIGNAMVGHGTAIRWGGEEFLFIFDGYTEQQAGEMLRAVLDEIRETVVSYDGQDIRFTMSYGVIAGDLSRSYGEDINLADERLYYAKEHGRNRVVTGAQFEEENEMAAGKAADKENELWDIYDANKQLTGRTMKRNVWTLADDEYHLTVLGVIVDKSGKYLITKRVMTKSWAPGWWEVSGGAAMAGETSEEAVRREVLEETGIDVTGAEGGFEFCYHRENPGEGDNYFVDVYRYVVDFKEEDIKLQEEETDGYKLATLEEVEALGAEGVFLHFDSIRRVFR